MYKRTLTQTIIDALDQTPAVAILGPRQVGKTTLAHAIGTHRRAIYLDLENPEEFQKLRDPADYLGLHADKLVILDEIQRYPNLFMSLRGIIDARKRAGRGNGQFLVLGSASADLLKQRAESLAGRIRYVELTGLNPLEIDDISKVPTLWLRGGFPDSYKASSDTKSNAWRSNFIKTYLERDIPQLGPRIPATTLRRFWTMIAHAQGDLFNASKLAGSLGISSVTTTRYLDLMVDLLLVRRLEPWYGNTKKRLVKSPRVYVRDSGLVHTLLHIPDYEYLLGHPILGKSWEGFVIEAIIATVPAHVTPFFYKTAAGAEIDLVLEVGLTTYWAIAIKASRTPTLKKGFYTACDDLNATRKFVVYTGDDKFSLGNSTVAIALPLLLKIIQQLAV